MAVYPCNIWIVKEQEFEQFTFTGGKVIYIVEDTSPMFKAHPAIITAGTLLPPMQAVQAELDGNLIEAKMIYENYLRSEEASMYISIIAAAAVKQIPIGIMFGRDELNMQFPSVLIDFLFHMYGLVIGVANVINPYIVEEALPYTLANLYCLNIIDYPTYLEKHPQLPLHQMAISKLAIEINPWVQNKTFEGYYAYFEEMKKATHRNHGKFAVDPMGAI